MQFIVMGINRNTSAQLRRMTCEDEFPRILEEEHFRRSRIGSFLVWERGKGKE